MADQKHMPVDMARRLEAGGIIPPRPWPRLDQLERCVRQRRGSLSLETVADGATTARVTLLGNHRMAVAELPAQAVAMALADAIDAANPQLVLAGGGVVSQDTGELTASPTQPTSDAPPAPADNAVGEDEAPPPAADATGGEAPPEIEASDDMPTAQQIVELMRSTGMDVRLNDAGDYVDSLGNAYDDKQAKWIRLEALRVRSRQQRDQAA